MLRLRDATIRRKLTAITMIPIAAVTVLTITVFIVWEQIDSRRDLVRDLFSRIEMLSDNCKASLAFEHKQDAEQVLSSLRAHCSTVFARIFDTQGMVFAEYKRNGVAEKTLHLKHQRYVPIFENGLLSVSGEIVLDNDVIGVIQLVDDMSRQRSELKWNIVTGVMIVGAALAAGYLLASRLQVVISVPILDLARVASEVSKKKDYSVRAWEGSSDEVGYLTRVFNTMLEQIQQRDAKLGDAKQKLEARVRERTAELIVANERLTMQITERKQAEAELRATQEKLIEAAHGAGMAEVAADVLHNVGNVLNSINVSTTLITEKVAKSELANLQKVAAIINEHINEIGTFITQDAQGKHIPTYLAEVSKCLQAEQSDIIGKLHVLANNVQHIKDIISMQQAYAKVSGVSVRASLTQLVEDAIQINSAGLQRHGTRLVREFEELPDIEIDKQRVLQILVNLISNAKYALRGSDKEGKLLTIRIYRCGEDRFRIEVADNGLGIPKENLTKIFSHGFTTKQHGHGFGLHSGALAAKDLGGSLTVHSDGLGKGATFTLELPFKPARVTQ